MPTHRCVSILIGAVAIHVVSAAAMAQAPVLTLEGSCPGMLRAEVAGAPPRHGLSLLFASETGSLEIPPHSHPVVVSCSASAGATSEKSTMGPPMNPVSSPLRAWRGSRHAVGSFRC